MKLCPYYISSNSVLYAVDVLPKKVDPQESLDYVENIISEAVTSQLYEYDESNNTYVEKNVEKVLISDDKLSYTFYLSQDMYWNDGTKVRAMDFVNSFFYTMKLGDYSPICNVVDAIKNWDDVLAGELNRDALGVKALDEYVLQIELDYPMPYLAELLSKIYISPRKTDKESGELLYSGLYYIELCNGHEIVLKRNKYFSYNKEEQKVCEKIIFRLFTDMYKVLELYKKGEVAITCNTQFPYELIKKSSQYEDFHVVHNSGLSYVLHTKDVKLRKEISAILNRELISERLYNGIAPQYSFLSRDSSREQVEYGYKVLCSGNEVSLIYSNYYPNQIVAEEIKKQLEERTGVRIKIIEKSLDQLIEHINQEKFEIALDICSFSVCHPIAICFSLLNNLPESSVDEVISLIEEFYNGGELKINRLDQILNEGLAILPLFKLKSLQFVNSSINCYQVKEDGSMVFN